jgi:hypothetical protein
MLGSPAQVSNGPGSRSLYPGQTTWTLWGTLLHASGEPDLQGALKVRVALESGMGPHKPGLSGSHTSSKEGAGPKLGGSCPAGVGEGRPRALRVQPGSACELDAAIPQAHAIYSAC